MWKKNLHSSHAKITFDKALCIAAMQFQHLTSKTRKIPCQVLFLHSCHAFIGVDNKNRGLQSLHSRPAKKSCTVLVVKG
jgi:hypothetical protein